MAVAVTFGNDFAPPCGNSFHQAPQPDYLATHSTNGLDFSPAILENAALSSPGLRRVKLPLIRSRRPATVQLTNAQIEELLD